MKKFYHYLYIIGFMVVTLNTYGKTEIEKENETADNSINVDRIVNNDIEVTVPSIVFTFKEANIKLKFKNSLHPKLLLNDNKLHFIINGEDIELTFINGETSFYHEFNDDNPLAIYIEEFSYNKHITAYSLWSVILLIICLFLIWIIRKIKNIRIAK